MFTALLGLAWALPDQPLSKDDITVLLLAGSQNAKIIQTVEQRGVDFQMSPDLAKKLHDLGASDDLIEALQKAGNKAATAHMPPAAGTEPNAPEAPVATSGSAPGGSEASSAGPTSNAPSSGPSQKPSKSKLKDRHSVRMGEFLVTAASVEDEPLSKRSGPLHRVFAVDVRIQNVGKRFPCSSLSASLVVQPFYQYSASFLSDDRPSTHELLPGETAEGRYSFDIRDGVVPKELVLKSQDSRDTRCAEHVDWGSSFHYRSEARIPIEGLPAEDESAREATSRPNDVDARVLKRGQMPLATTEQKREVEQQPSTTIVMDDGFEYSVVDYGVGQVQVGPALGDKDALSEPLFWIEFGITNASEHLLGVPRYLASGALTPAIVDNWGNNYSARYQTATTLAVPPRKFGRYKPQESSVDLVVIPLEEFVNDIVELRVYLNRYAGYRDWHFFSLQGPMLRHRNLIQGQFKPSTAELGVATGKESQQPTQLRR